MKRIKQRILLNELYTYVKAVKTLQQTKEPLQEAFRELVGTLNNIVDDTQPSELTPQERLLIRSILDRHVEKISKQQIHDIEQLLSSIYTDILETNSQIFKKEFRPLKKEDISKVVNKEFHGRTFSERIWRNNTAIARRIEKDLSGLMSQERDLEDIVRKVQQDYNTSYSNSKRLIQTEASRVFNQANEDSYKRYGISKVKYIAEHDTCPHCRELDGITYNLKDAPKVPQHPYCRCVHIPVLED